MDDSDRNIIRELARRVADIASRPVMRERIALWKRHNSLRPARPMVLVFPEGSWRELLPPSALECRDEEARRIEASLRRRLFYDEILPDDTVVDATWLVPKIASVTGWGLEPRNHPSSDPTGAWGFDPVLNSRSDLEKITMPQVVYDEAEARSRLDSASSLFGDILDVRLAGTRTISFHLGALYAYRRGLEQMMIDMYTDPALIHETMALFEKGCAGLLQQYLDNNLLDLNNDNSYQNSGGNSWTDELPAPGFNPDRVRLRDLWAAAESQELAQVSPDMHREFVWQYERRLLEPFGLTGYGCCEDLTRKLDFVTALPNMRRISVSPWADVDKCAERLGGRFIFSWKPNPAMLCGSFDENAVRSYVQHAADAARANGCVLEMVLKDTHTCENRPERFTRWLRIASEIALSSAG
ncbi:MAG: hypothetical protein JW909_04495 [Planctomycetes bacterium]|nr:hypothetical protein [Planctomycetota bacterium]